MEVVPGVGIGDLHFGLSESEVVERLGQPDKTYVTHAGCKRALYNALRLELSFEPESDFRLGWIEAHHPDTAIFGRRVIGAPEDEVLTLVSDHIGNPTDEDDYGSFRSVSYDDHWIELQFWFGCLHNVNAGVLYDDSDEPLWPDT